MIHHQVLTGIEVDNMRRERPTKTRIFCAEIQSSKRSPANKQQKLVGILHRNDTASVTTSEYCNRS